MFVKAAKIFLIGVIFQTIYICTSVQGSKVVLIYSNNLQFKLNFCHETFDFVALNHFVFSIF